MNIKYIGKDKLSLHSEVGAGTMPNGRKCRLCMNNVGLEFQVYNKKGTGWDSYFVSWLDISREFSESIENNKFKMENKE